MARPAPRYRIEHRGPDGAAVVVGVADRPTIPATVGGHRDRLRAAGAAGRLVLVDQRYGVVVAASDLGEGGDAGTAARPPAP